MKAKIYPLLNLNDEVITIPCSVSFFNAELILASLANGVSVIRNVPSNINETLLNWCRQIGANIKTYPEKIVVKGVNNKLNFKNSMFVSDDIKIIQLFLPIFASCNQPIGIKTSKENIELLHKHKEILEKFKCLYFEEDNKIRIERELEPLDLSIESGEDISFALSYILVAPLLKGTSKIKLEIPVFYYTDYKTILRLLKKFSIDAKLTKDMVLEIPGNQNYKACKIKTEMDSYIASSFGLLANHYQKKIKIKGYTHHFLNDGMFFDYLNKKEFNSSKHNLSCLSIKKDINSLNKIEASFIRGGICFGTLLFLLRNKEGKITKVNFNNRYHQTFIHLFEEGFNKTNIKLIIDKNDIIIKPSFIDKKIQFDVNNNTYVAVTISLLALISKAPVTLKNIDSFIIKYPTFFENLSKLGAKIEYIHD